MLGSVLRSFTDSWTQLFPAVQRIRPYATKPAAKGKPKKPEAPKSSGFKRAKAASKLPAVDQKSEQVLRFVSLLLPSPVDKLSQADEKLTEARRRARAYNQLKREEHNAWHSDLSRKLMLQRRAMTALPKQLRLAARKPDLAPIPPCRSVLFQTPPTAYLE